MRAARLLFCYYYYYYPVLFPVGPGMGQPMQMGQPMVGMGMQGGPPNRQGRPGPDSNEPPAKKQKTEESLMPEEQFLARNKVGSILNFLIGVVVLLLVLILICCGLVLMKKYSSATVEFEYS